MEKTSLFQVLTHLREDQGTETIRQLSKVFKQYVDDGTWVLIPVQDDDGAPLLCIHEERGKHFAVMFSDESEVRTNTGSVIMTDFNKLLNPVFANTNLDGIVIDPNTNGMCFEKGFLLKCIMHGYLPQQDNSGCPPKDWGPGMPDYKTEDLMTEGELLNFAMHVVLDHEKSISSYIPVSACDHTDANVNFIFEKEGKFIFVTVKGYCAEEEPTLNDEEKEKLLFYRDIFNTDCYYAPVGFRSAVSLPRFNECIALKGDEFAANYEGLQPIE